MAPVRDCELGGTIEDVDGRKSFAFNQLDYITDEADNLIVDFVGRYENLERDTNQVLRMLGLAEQPMLHMNKSAHRHYTDYYSPTTRDIVAERFARDIAFFGYEFHHGVETRSHLATRHLR